MIALLRFLIIVQMFIAVAGLAAAMVDVGFAVVCGPAVAACGFIIAGLSFRAGRVRGLIFGLGGPTIAVAIGCWIAIERWSPRESQEPVAFALAMFVPVYLIVAVKAFLERPSRMAPLEQRGWQFSVGTLLTLMLVVAVALASYRTAGGGSVGIAVAIATTHTVIVSWVLRQFLHRPVFACESRLGTSQADKPT